MSIDRNSSYAHPYHNTGLLYHELGDYRKAEIFYLEALVKDPNIASIYVHLAEIYTKQNKHAQAQEMYNKANALK